jgi:hypothetical protein
MPSESYPSGTGGTGRNWMGHNTYRVYDLRVGCYSGSVVMSNHADFSSATTFSFTVGAAVDSVWTF